MIQNRSRGMLVALALLMASAPALMVGCSSSSSAPATPSTPADTTAPTVVITGASATPVSAPVTLTFTFSEDVGTSFAASDVTVTNGTKAATVTKVDATHYTLVVTPPASSTGTMTISIAVGAFSDLANNANTVAASATQAFNTVPPDTTAPTVAISGTSGTPVTGALTLTFTFSEDVGTSFDASDVTVTNGTKAATVTKVDATHYTLVVTPPATSTGTMTFSIAVGAFSDLVNNSNTAAVSATQAYNTVIPDTTAPTVAISGTSGTPVTGALTLTFTFSEDVGTSFDASDVTVTNGTKAATVTKVDATHYTLFVTPLATSVGTMTFSIAVGTFSDLANNANTVAASATQDYNTIVPVGGATLLTFDETVPPVLSPFEGVDTATIVADPAGGANQVMQVVNSATANPWAGVTVSTGYLHSISRMMVTDTNTVLTARVYSPAVGLKVRAKAENAENPAQNHETDATTTTTVANAWETLTFDFKVASPLFNGLPTNPFSATDTYNMISFFFDYGTKTVARTFYMDTVVFQGTLGSFLSTPPPPTVPTTLAVAPTLPAANVIAMLNSSGVYTNIAVGNWNPNWGQGGSIADIVVASKTIKVMNLLNYQGINVLSLDGAVSGPTLNITGKNTLHISYFAAGLTSFSFFPINAATEYAIPSGTLAQGVWTELEIPINQGGFDLTTIRQLKFDKLGGPAGTIYLDNIYFH